MRTQTLRTCLILLAGIKFTRLTKPYRNFSDNDTDFADNYTTRLKRTYQYDDRDFANGGQRATTKGNSHVDVTQDGQQHRPMNDEKNLQHSESIWNRLATNNQTATVPTQSPAFAIQSRIVNSGNAIGEDRRGEETHSEGDVTTENGNPNVEEAEVEQRAVDNAVKDGLKELHDLYFVKEPLLYKMGLYLDSKEAASRVAAFSKPNPKALLHAKYGFATVQASLKLAQRYANNLGRQNLEFGPNLKTTLLDEQCPLRGTPRCALASKRYRTADGTCNNIQEPWRGSSMTPMQRFLPPTYEDGIQSPRRSIFNKNLPSPRRISTTIHRDKNRSVPSITLMFMQWGQFLDHDVTLTATSRAFNTSVPRCCLPGGNGFLPAEFMHLECMPIEVPHDDWFLNQFGIRCMEFIRSAPATRINCELGWREQINQVTSYIDGSMIYGSDVRRAESLRTFRGGALRYGRQGSNKSPPDPPDGEICRSGAISTSCFHGGDSRFGEQPALTALHTIWLRFHNKIALSLQNFNPRWSDEKLYQETRRIISSLIQHITYREFLPVVLGQEVIESFDLKLLPKEYYTGYDPKTNPTTANAFSTAAFRFGHSLVQNSFVRSTINHQRLLNNVSIHDEQENPENIWSQGSLDRLILGLCNQPSQMRDEFIGDELTNHLFQSNEVPFGMDLAAINIQRGRDHGIPPYTSWRQPCGLSSINSWQDLSKVMRPETIQLLRTLYAHVDDIDLYSGGLAEKPVRGGMVGPVFACIIAQQFLNYRKGDRFWYENGNFKSSFTLDQLQQIRNMNFAHVICHTITEIHNIQPFLFLASDDEQNSRISCKNLLGNGIDLTPWIEEDINQNSIDLNQNLKLEPLQEEPTNLFATINQHNSDLFGNAEDDFNFEKGFQKTVDALKIINNENVVNLDPNNIGAINIDDFGNNFETKIFTKRSTTDPLKKNVVEGKLILMRNLKNMKIHESYDRELRKSANISSEITILPKKEDNPLDQRIVNHTILLLKRNQHQKTSSNSFAAQTSRNGGPKVKINDPLSDSRTNERSKSNPVTTRNRNTDDHRYKKPDSTDTRRKVKAKLAKNKDDDKVRSIDDYIIDTIGEFYYDDDYDSEKIKNNKRNKRPTTRPNQTKRKGTHKPANSGTNKPNQSNKLTITSDSTDDDGEGGFILPTNTNGHGFLDYVDPPTLTHSQYPDDIRKVHYADDYLDDPIMTDDGTNFPNLQVNVNIHLDSANKPTLNTDYSNRPSYGDTKNKPLVQVSLMQKDKNMTGHPLKTNNNYINFANGHKELTNRPSATSYPIYVLNNNNNRLTQKVTYVTGYMIEEPTTKATNFYDVPTYASKRPYTNRRPAEELEGFTAKTPYRPIIILRPHDFDGIKTHHNTYNAPVQQTSAYLTARPFIQTTRRTTRGPETSNPLFPNYFTIHDKINVPNQRPNDRNDDPYDHFETVHHHLNKPNKLVLTLHNNDDSIHKVEDKLDFKTNFLPHRLKLSSDQNYVKISSAGKGHDLAKESDLDLESKEEGSFRSQDNDIPLPELEGIKIVQIDVLPSDDKYKLRSSNTTGEPLPMPKILKLFPNDTDCALELPKPMKDMKNTPPEA